MSINLSAEVIQSFSYQKILKSLKKFGVNISESELNELIANSYSLHEVTDFLIKKFNLKSLISSNLPRFISCYWELMFHDKWPIEMIIDMMNEARIPILDEEYQEYFTRYTDLFNHAKELFFNLQLLKNSDLRSDFKESLSKWLIKFLILFQKIIPFPQEQMDLFLELSAFIKQNPHFSATESTNSFLKSKLNFVHAQILYLGNSKENAFKFLDELHNEDVPVSEVLFQKLQLLVEKYDKSLANKTFLDFEKFLDSDYTFVDDKQIFGIINNLQFLQSNEHGISKITDVILAKLRPLFETIEESKEKNSSETIDKDNLHDVGEYQEENNFDEDVLDEDELDEDELDEDELDEDDFDDEEFDEEDEFEYKEFDNIDSLISRYNDGIKKPKITNSLDDILFADEPITIFFECASCGLLYEKEVDQVFIPYNWNTLLLENKTVEENGLILFNCEINCPICSSYKFFINLKSKMLFISLVEHIKNLDDDLEYDPGDTTNTIVIGNFVSKFAKESTSMRESLSKLESLLQSDPENEEFMVSIGNTLLWLNDYTEAQKVFKRILEKNNKNFDAWFNLAKIYFNRKNVKQCEKVVDNVIEIIGNDRILFETNITYLVYIDDIVHRMNNLKMIKRLKKLFKQFEFN